MNEIKCYILITLMYMPNRCRLVWNKNYMLSEISIKAFRSGRKLVGPAETDIVYCRTYCPAVINKFQKLCSSSFAYKCMR